MFQLRDQTCFYVLQGSMVSYSAYEDDGNDLGMLVGITAPQVKNAPHNSSRTQN